MVNYFQLQDLNDICLIWLRDFKDSLFFCHYEISMKIGLVSLWDFNDGRFCSVTRSQWRLVFSVSWFCSVTRFQRWSGLIGYEISMTDSFIPLQAFNDICFIRLRDFKDSGVFFVTRSQWRLVLFLCSFSRFQWRSVLFLCSYNDGPFCSVTRSQWRLVFSVNWFCSVIRFQRWSGLFGYDISMMVSFVSLFFFKISKRVGFVSLWDFNDGRFCSVTRSQWRMVFSVSWFCSVIWFQTWSGLFGYQISVTVSFIQLRAFDDIYFIRLRGFKDSRFCFVMRF